VPNRKEHLRAERKLLGSKTPLVHILLDSAIKQYGYQHRYLTHNAEFIKLIEQCLGKDAKRTAIIHILQDWKCIRKGDY
jgi:hypothetical protein